MLVPSSPSYKPSRELQIVEELLRDGNHRCVVHAINVCEVYYDLYRRDGEEIADGVEEILEGYGFELDDEMPSSLWRAAGKLKGKWARVSLADCFALARAMRDAATLVSSDHHELDPIAKAQVCPIRFIR